MSITHLRDVLDLAALERERWSSIQAQLRASGVPLADEDEEQRAQRPRTIDQLQERQTEIRQRLTEINQAHEGQVMADEAREEWNDLGRELQSNSEVIEEMEVREATLREIAEGGGEGRGAERGSPAGLRPASRGVHARSNLPENIWDVFAYRQMARSLDHETSLLHSGAMRAVEQAQFPHQIEREQAQEHIENTLGALGNDLDPDLGISRQSDLSRRIITTGSPTYRRALVKYIAGKARSPEEERALTVGTGSAGGFALVYTLDPTIIPTSNLSVNPYRAMARVETIAGTNEWRGVTSAGVTASRVAELTEATDNSPTLAQPAVVVQRVQAFVPFSIELGMDWGALQTDMVQLLQDAKDDEEATSFTTGGGTAPAAQGIITGATNTVAAASAGAFVVSDVYKVWEALPPRFRPRAAWAGNLAQFDRTRQFDTAGGASIFVQNLQIGFNNQGGPGRTGDIGATLLGKPAYESSAMASTITTGSKILTVGDWRYFIIVDRVGMDVEVIPHIFGASNRYPTGQRALYAFWRNNSKVLDANAFRVLQT